MNVFLGNRGIGSRGLGNLLYFDVPSGAFPVPWGQGKECKDPEKCSRNALQGSFEGVSAEEYRRRQEALRSGMGFTLQEQIVPVGAPAVSPTVMPTFWPGYSPAYLFPTTTPEAAAAPAESQISTNTLLIGGAVLLAGIAVIAFVTR